MSDDLVTRLRAVIPLGRALTTSERFEAAMTAKEAADEIARLRAALDRIHQRCEAYPETVFTVPDLDRMREVLTKAGMPTALDAAHGTWARKLLKDIGDICAEQLQQEKTR